MPSFSSSANGRRNFIAISAIGDLLARAPFDIIASILSILGGTISPGQVGFVTTWVLIFAVLFNFCPFAYTPVKVIPAHKDGFRAIFAAAGVSSGIVLQLSGSLRPSVFAIGLFGIYLLAGFAFLYYLIRVQKWAVFDPEGQLASIFVGLFPQEKEKVREELKTELSYKGSRRVVVSVNVMLAVGAIISFPVPLAGVAAQTIVYMFPVPDLVILGWAASVQMAPRLSVGPNRNQIGSSFDFDRLLIDATGSATRSVLGLFLTMFVIVGLFGSAVYFYFSLIGACLDA